MAVIEETNSFVKKFVSNGIQVKLFLESEASINLRVNLGPSAGTYSGWGPPCWWCSSPKEE
jgi:hypothetical protein